MTGLELARGTTQVLNVRTGELLDIADASTEDIADAREALVTLDHDRKTAVGMLDEELVRRTDQAVRTGELKQYTFEVGDLKVEVDATQKRRVSADDLRHELLRLADSGEVKVTPEAVENAFKPRYYLYARPWATLVRLDPRLGQVYERHSTPLRRSAKVTRLAPAPIEGTAEEVAA